MKIIKDGKRKRSKKYKQHEVAGKIGVGLEHYQKMESGKKRIPLWRIQMLGDDPEIDMDLNYVIFGSQEAEDIQNDDVKEEFYALVRRNQEREKVFMRFTVLFVGNGCVIQVLMLVRLFFPAVFVEEK